MQVRRIEQECYFLYIFKLLICMHKKDHFTAMGLFINAQFWRSESDVFLFLGLHSELPWHFFLYHVHRQHTDHWLYRRNHRLLGCPEWRGGKSVRLQWYERKTWCIIYGSIRNNTIICTNIFMLILNHQSSIKLQYTW